MTSNDNENLVLLILMKMEEGKLPLKLEKILAKKLLLTSLLKKNLYKLN